MNAVRDRSATISLLALVAALVCATAAMGAPDRGAPDRDVHIRGTVYAFNAPDPIAGATVRVAELDGVVATTASDGSYDLAVPDGTRVTPYVEADGFHGIHLQTFTTQGTNIERANFQIPSDPVYGGLAALLGVELDEAGNQVNCAIVSTFSTVDVRDLSFADFTAFGAHGVGGATASTDPALPSPIYFNENVIPDPSRTESSEDGGVIWIEVPPGTYRVSASHPSERFAEFTASCEPGRLVNANPPQGLYQLRSDEVVNAKVKASIDKARFEARGRRGRVLRVRLRAKEYVTAQAKLTRGEKTLDRTPADEGIGAFEDGKQRASLEVRPGVDPGPVKLRVTFTDTAGNEKVSRERLHLPRKRGES
jgi:hypothetical protein